MVLSICSTREHFREQGARSSLAEWARIPVEKGDTLMAVRSGRLEKRIPLSLPVQVSNLYDPSKTERTSSENVCSLGMRLLTQKARELNERLMIRSMVGDLRALARVVYCQRLPDGRFGVGIQFQGQSVNWQTGPLASLGD